MGFEIINKIKKERGLTNAQIAEMSGITLSTLDKITSGVNKNPKLDTLQAICKVLGCTLNDFDEDAPRRPTTPYSAAALKLAHDYDNRLDNWGRETVRAVAETEVRRCEDEDRFLLETKEQLEPKVINLYLEPAAAGLATAVEGKDFIPIELGPEDPQGAAYAVRLQGDSMEPDFPDGSTVFVNHDSLVDGDIGIFSIDGGTVCKQYHRDLLGMVYLFSLNRARADADVVIHPSSNHTLICQGRVITKRRYPLPTSAI